MENVTNKPQVQFEKMFLTEEGLQLQRSLTNLRTELTKAIALAHEFERKKEKHERKKRADSSKTVWNGKKRGQLTI